MTTIIVVAIVALVFFVAMGVATFMTWKQETQMRTDSLKGIELSLNEVLNEITDRRTEFTPYQESAAPTKFGRRGGKRTGHAKSGRGHAEHEDDIDVTVFKPSDLISKRREARTAQAACDAEELIEAFEEQIKEEQKQMADVQVNESIKAEVIEKPAEEIFEETASEEAAHKKAETDDKLKIDLDFIDIDDLFELDEIIFNEDGQDRSSDYNTGRSGRKYTAEELEALIKE